MARITTQERSQYKVLKELGWTISGIARHYGRTRNDVKLWLQRTENDSNAEAVSEKRGRGRKRKSSMKEDEKIAKKYKTTWRTKGYGRRQMEQDLKKNPIVGVPQVSGKTIYRRLQEKAGKMIVVPQKFLLTDIHKKKRRKWATATKDEDFGTWLFSDETMFKIGGRKHTAFQFPREKLADIKYQQSVRQNVWACMSATGVGEMAFIDGTLTAKKYKAILQDKLYKAVNKLFPHGSWKLQHDNGPQHKSKVVQSWLGEQALQLADWPPSSPDMNVQENLHNIWKERVDALHPTSMQDLRDKIAKVFTEMTENDTRPLVDSMTRRVQALVNAKGGHTGY
jgi:DDE superfamily endonuclease